MTFNHSTPIGIFDSGLGGLSVYLHLHSQLPSRQFIYYADTLNIPYGNRSPDHIATLSHQAIDWLVDKGCRLIVIACNSASAYALQSARRRHPNITIVGLVPALKPAVLSSNSKKVAVLATQVTLNGTLLNTVIDQYATPSGVEVITHFDADLVPWVEQGMPCDHPVVTRLKHNVTCWMQHDADHLVLGCTHYPFFRTLLERHIQQLSELTGRQMLVVDSGKAIANRVCSLLGVSTNLASQSTALSRKQSLAFDCYYHDAHNRSHQQNKHNLVLYSTDTRTNLSVIRAKIQTLLQTNVGQVNSEKKPA